VHFSSKEHILKVHTYVDINHFTYMSHTSLSVVTGFAAITDQLGEAIIVKEQYYTMTLLPV